MARVIAVYGPTASGKSAAALTLAARLDAEIVNCDAMQLYAGLPVLTNQPSPEHLAQAPHHLVGVWPLSHEGSVAEYAVRWQRPLPARGALPAGAAAGAGRRRA
jgi:tRNA dimethylallyltransferase